MSIYSDKIYTLPVELESHIYDFNYHHRVIHKEKLNIVLDELDYVTNYIYCGNDMCEKEIYKVDSIESVVLNNVCYFCDEDCKSYGEWSIRYDYRKRHRLERQNQTTP